MLFPAEGKKVHMKPDGFESNPKIIWRKNVRYVIMGGYELLLPRSLMHAQPWVIYMC